MANKYRELLELYQEAPDNWLDVSWRPKIREHLSKKTTEKDDIKFVRNILDACVAFAHSCENTILIFKNCLKDAPIEFKEETKTRHFEAFPEYAKSLYGSH